MMPGAARRPCRMLRRQENENIETNPENLARAGCDLQCVAAQARVIAESIANALKLVACSRSRYRIGRSGGTTLVVNEIAHGCTIPDTGRSMGPDSQFEQHHPRHAGWPLGKRFSHGPVTMTNLIGTIP